MNDLENKVVELRRIGDLINQAITGLQNVLGAGTRVTIRNLRTVNRTTAVHGKRHLTAAAKRKISEKMKQKWAERKKAPVTGKTPVLVSRTKKAA